MITDAVRKHCEELRSVTATALADAKALNSHHHRRRQAGAASHTTTGGEGGVSTGAMYGPEGTGTVLLLLHHTVQQLATTLQEQADYVMAHPEAATTRDVAQARHDREDSAEAVLELRFQLNEERSRRIEAAEKLQQRDKLIGLLRAHMTREAVHFEATGAANLGAFPIELLDEMELTAARARLAAEKKVLTHERTFQQQLSRASNHSARLLEAKEKELVQMQLHFRNTMRALQATHAAEITRLTTDVRSLQEQLVAAEQTAIAKAGRFFLEKYRDVITQSEVDGDIRTLTQAAIDAKKSVEQLEALANEKRALQQQLLEMQRQTMALRDDLTNRLQAVTSEGLRADARHRHELKTAEDSLGEMTAKAILLEAQARSSQAQAAMELEALAGEIAILRDEATMKDALNGQLTTSLGQAQRMVGASVAETRAVTDRLNALIAATKEASLSDGGGTEAGRKQQQLMASIATQAADEQAAKAAEMQRTIAALEARGQSLEQELGESRRDRLADSRLGSSLLGLGLNKAVQCDIGSLAGMSSMVAVSSGSGVPPPPAPVTFASFTKKGPEATMPDRKINATLRVRLTQLFLDLQTAETRFRGLQQARLQSERTSSGIAEIGASGSRSAGPPLRYEAASPGSSRPELSPIPQLTKEDVAQQNHWFIDEMRSREAELQRFQDAIAQEEVRRLREQAECRDTDQGRRGGGDDRHGSPSPEGASTSPEEHADRPMSAAAFASAAATQSAFRVVIPIVGAMPTPSTFKGNVAHLRDLLREKFDQPAAGGVEPVPSPQAPALLLTTPRSAGGVVPGAMRPKRPASARLPSARDEVAGPESLIDVLRSGVSKASNPASYFAVGRSSRTGSGARRATAGHLSSMVPPGAALASGTATNVAVTSYTSPRVKR